MGEGSGELEWESLTEVILGCAIQAQRGLGPGRRERACEPGLARELEKAGLRVQRQLVLGITDEEIQVPSAPRIGLRVEDRIVVGLKTVERLTDFHEAQLLTYLRFSGKRIGLLLNFWRWPLKGGGIKRLLNPKAPPLSSDLLLPPRFLTSVS